MDDSTIYFRNTQATEGVAIYSIADEYKPGEWEVQLFGMGRNGITLRPGANQPVPGWFWRQMQYLFFGNKWVKK